MGPAPKNRSAEGESRRARPAPIVAPPEAAGILEAGGMVLVPTDTLFGIAASGAARDPLDRLWAAVNPDGAGRGALAWHAPGVERVLGVVPELTALHRRLVQRLSPGGVMFAVGLNPGELAAARDRAGLAPGAADDGSELLVRIPGHPATLGLLNACHVPIVVAGLPVARADRLRDVQDAWSALERTSAADAIEGVLDAPPAPRGTPSTLIRLRRGAGYEVVREGAVQERYVRNRLARNILFVCTGNTCRSPMAQAIARHLLAGGPADLIPTSISSAGVRAYPGAPVTPEALEALRELGIDTGHWRHTSTPLTREMLSDADAVFAMTASHAASIREIDPGASSRVQVLDPAGGDVPDPIGQSARVYDETARALLRMIEARFKEFGLITTPGPAENKP